MKRKEKKQESTSIMSKGMAQTFDEFQQHFHATGVLDSTFREGMESIPYPSISITAVSTQYEKFHT
jgi:hypothetical protein